VGLAIEMAKKKEETLREKLKDVKWAQKSLLLYQHAVHEESFRGGLLVAAAHLDESLLQLLVNFMVPEKSMLKLFEYRGPLGDFSSKIDMSYAFGLISKDEHHDLHIIRKIRNTVAHCQSLEEEARSIEDQASNLIHGVEDAESGDDSRSAIHFNVVLLMLRLSERLRNVRSQKEAKPLEDDDLVVGWD
jgi:DNA-binding MltR family transcriptional regulator